MLAAILSRARPHKPYVQIVQDVNAETDADQEDMVGLYGNASGLFFVYPEFVSRSWVPNSVIVWKDLKAFVAFVRQDSATWTRMRSSVETYVVVSEETEAVVLIEERVPLIVTSLVFLITVYNDNSILVKEVFKYSLSDNSSIGISVQDAMACVNDACSEECSIWCRRNNWSSIHINTTIATFAPLAIWEDPRQDPSGLFPELFMQISYLLGFTFNVVHPLNNIYGVHDPKTGQYNGTLGMIQRHEVEIGITGYSITGARAKVMDFSHEIINEEYRIVIRNRGEQLGITQTISVFSPTLWVSLAVVAVVSMAGGTIIISRMNLSSLSTAFTNACALVSRAFIGHRYPGTFTWLSDKIFLMSVMLLSLVILGYYRGALLSHLAIRREVDGIKTLEDILDKNYKIGCFPYTMLQDEFSAAPPGSVKFQIWETIMRPHFDEVMLANRSLIFEKICSEDNFAFLVVPAYSSSLTPPCTLKIADAKYSETPIAFALPKDSPIAPALNYYLDVLRENGVLDKLVTKWLRSPGEMEDHCENTHGDQESLSIYAVAGGFIFPLAGGVLAVICLMAELMTALATKKKTSLEKIRATRSERMDQIVRAMHLLVKEIDLSKEEEEKLVRCIVAKRKHL